MQFYIIYSDISLHSNTFTLFLSVITAWQICIGILIVQCPLTSLILPQNFSIWEYWVYQNGLNQKAYSAVVTLLQFLWFWCTCVFIKKKKTGIV